VNSDNNGFSDGEEIYNFQKTKKCYAKCYVKGEPGVVVYLTLLYSLQNSE
jgi:hypothetical protein